MKRQIFEWFTLTLFLGLCIVASVLNGNELGLWLIPLLALLLVLFFFCKQRFLITLFKHVRRKRRG